VAKKEIEFTADELSVVRSILGIAGGTRDTMDLGHRLKLMELFDFTEEEREAINYREQITADQQVIFLFNESALVIRKLTPHQRLKLRTVIKQNLGSIRGAKLAATKTALLKLGCPPEEFEDDEDEEKEEE